MQQSSHSAILSACRYFLLPLARLLLRYGIGYKEFSEVCRAAFVEVASKDYGRRGRPANLSRVAILTGVSRKEVKRIRDSEWTSTAKSDSHGMSPASMVLRAWYSDPAYLSGSGTPLALYEYGTGPTLASLVKLYAGDLPVTAVVSELKRVGVVEELSSGGLRPVGRYFIPPTSDSQLFASGATSIHNLISTIAFNATPGNDTKRLFERYAWSRFLPSNLAEKFHAFIHQSGSAYLEEVDKWLKEHEARSGVSDQSGEFEEIGVGLYYFDNNGSERAR